jgi:hypothetical protein
MAVNSQDEVVQGVEVVTSDDLEDFSVRLGEAVGKWSGPLGTPPSVAFSHTATEDGFNYAAIVIGRGSGGPRETRVIEHDG